MSFGVLEGISLAKGLYDMAKGNDYDQGYAAPTGSSGMLPQQTELLNAVKPVVLNQMYKPPVVQGRPLKMTKISLGGTKTKYTPGQTTGAKQPTTMYGATAPQAVSSPSTGGQAPASSGNPPPIVLSGREVTAQDYKNAMGVYPPGWRVSNGTLQWSAPNTPRTAGEPQDNFARAAWGLAPLDNAPAGNIKAPPGASQSDIQQMIPGAYSNGSYGESFDYQPGEIQLPNTPDLQFSRDSLYNYTPFDQTEAINRLGQGLESDPNAGYREFDQTGRINEYGNALTVSPDAGYREFDQTGRINEYGNALTVSPDAGYRPVTEGYSDEVLKALVGSRLDPLTEQKDLEMRKATEEFNRRGMAASGFEFGQKYGTGATSIDRNYQQSVGNIQRDIAIQNAERIKADQAANEAARSKWVGFDQNTQLANKGLSQNAINMLSGQNAANEAARSNWAGFEQNTQLANKGLSQNAINMLSGQNAANEAARAGWADYNRTGQLADKNLSQTAIGLLSGQNQQNVSNQQWKDSFDQNAMEYSNAAKLQDFNTNLGLAQYLAGREDTLANNNNQLDMALQEKNIGLSNDAINRVLSTIYGLQPAANAATNIAQTAYQNQRDASAQNANDLSSIAALLSGLGGAKKTTVPMNSNSNWS